MLFRSAWSYGRVDCQLSKGKCSSYVAGYVNSSVLVPKVLTLPTLCPFCVHSQKLGQGFLQSERAKVYSLTPEQFIKRSIVINGKYKEFDVWRSSYAYLFPKCKGFAGKSSRERAYSYGIYDTARRLFPSAETTFALAKEIVGYIYYFHNKKDTYCLDIFGEVSDQSDLYHLAQYFFEPEIVNYSLDSIEMCRYVHRIYTELLLSKLKKLMVRVLFFMLLPMQSKKAGNTQKRLVRVYLQHQTLNGSWEKNLKR